MFNLRTAIEQRLEEKALFQVPDWDGCLPSEIRSYTGSRAKISRYTGSRVWIFSLLGGTLEESEEHTAKHRKLDSNRLRIIPCYFPMGELMNQVFSSSVILE